jgi:hypothetical protein
MPGDNTQMEDDDSGGNYILTQRRKIASVPAVTEDKPDPTKTKKLAALLRKPGQ